MHVGKYRTEDKLKIQTTQKISKNNPETSNNTKHGKPWFSRLLRHSARKQNGLSWPGSSALVSINVVTLRRARLILGWVTVSGRVNHLGITSHLGQLSLSAFRGSPTICRENHLCQVAGNTVWSRMTSDLTSALCSIQIDVYFTSLCLFYDSPKPTKTQFWQQTLHLSMHCADEN